MNFEDFSGLVADYFFVDTIAERYSMELCISPSNKSTYLSSQQGINLMGFILRVCSDQFAEQLRSISVHT